MQDIVCTCGPRDHEAEELTATSSLALLLSGSFVVRDQHGTSLLSEGSYLLVNAGHCFACSHRHGEGDRCLSFRFAPELFERIAHDAGAKPAFAHKNAAGQTVRWGFHEITPNSFLWVGEASAGGEAKWKRVVEFRAWRK